jgi:metal-responsive CopG/Arc/MetJ family transcriptional regulator
VFGSKTNVKLEKDLVQRIDRYSRIAGYSSPAEFITHAVEKELLLLEDADSEEEIRKRLQGLGYIS